MKQYNKQTITCKQANSNSFACVFAHSQTLQFSDRQLAVTIAARPEFIAHRQTSMPSVVLAFCLVLVVVVVDLLAVGSAWYLSATRASESARAMQEQHRASMLQACKQAHERTIAYACHQLRCATVVAVHHLSNCTTPVYALVIYFTYLLFYCFTAHAKSA